MSCKISRSNAVLPGFTSSTIGRPVLGCVGKHFDEVVMQAVVELALQVPGELGVIQVSGMDREHVGMDGNRRVLQVDQNLDDAIRFARGESQQGMVVESEVIKDLG